MDNEQLEPVVFSPDDSQEDTSSLPFFQLSNPVIKINRDGEVRLANKSARPLLKEWGCQPGDLVPKSLYNKVQSALEQRGKQQSETVADQKTYVLQIEPFPDRNMVILQAVEVTSFLDSEIRYRTLLQTCPDIFYQLDRDGYIQFINQNVSKFGYSATGLIDQHITTIVHPDDKDTVANNLVLSSGEQPTDNSGELDSDGLEIKLDIPGEADRLFEVKSEPLYDQKGSLEDRRVMGTVGVIRDVTKERQMKQELADKEQRLRTMADNFDEVFWMFDGKFQNLLYVNDQIERIYGISPDQLKEDGLSFFDFIYPDHRSRVRQGINQLRDGEKVDLEYRVNKDEDYRRWVSVRGVPVFDDDGSVEKIIGSSRDITQRKQYEKELEEARKKLKQKTYEDPLLNIPNRRLFDERLREEWARSRREETPLSMLMADIDFFKNYNDCYGHQQGDRCLKNLANTLEKELERETDFVARYGGEEFAIILPNTDQEGLEKIGERLRTAVLNQEIRHEESEVSDYVTISLGGATIIPRPSIDYQDFLDVVDEHLYKAKDSGRNQVKIAREQGAVNV